MTQEELTREQRRLLNKILDFRIAHKAWPSLHAVERALRKEFDVVRVASSLKDRFGHTLSTENREHEIALPFSAIRLCERAVEYYAVMPKLIAVMWEIYDTTEEKPVITTQDLKLREWKEEEIADAFLMLRHEGPFSGSGSYTGPTSFSVDIRNTIYDYRHVKSPADYIRTREAEAADATAKRTVVGGVPAFKVPPSSRGRVSGTSGRVFVVHGHDTGIKNEVARTLEQLGLEPVILHEQADGGRTIIEKLEGHGNVDFAVVLVTPDDELQYAKTGERVQRPRQNVILELGYFLSQLGRSRVFILKRSSDHMELPSDYDGVVYTAADEHGGWRLRLLKELREAGFEVDANRLK